MNLETLLEEVPDSSIERIVGQLDIDASECHRYEQPLSKRGAAVLQRLIEQRGSSDYALNDMAIVAWSSNDYSAVTILNSLLVAEVLFTNGDSHLLPKHAERVLFGVVEGVEPKQDGKPKEISSLEELNETVTLSRFVLINLRNRDLVDREILEGRDYFVMNIRNDRLRAAALSHPELHYDIQRYCIERVFEPIQDHQVDAMMMYLKETVGTPSLSGGWL